MIHNWRDFETVAQRRWRVEEERRQRERIKRHWDEVEQRWVIDEPEPEREVEE